MPKTNKSLSAVEAGLEAHERECAVRYEYIEKRLEEGGQKFRRIETMLWGLYGLVAAVFGATILLDM